MREGWLRREREGREGGMAKREREGREGEYFTSDNKI